MLSTRYSCEWRWVWYDWSVELFFKYFSHCGCFDMFDIDMSDISLKSFEMFKDHIIRLISFYYSILACMPFFDIHMHYAQMHFITCYCIVSSGNALREHWKLICFHSISKMPLDNWRSIEHCHSMLHYLAYKCCSLVCLKSASVFLL